MKIIKTFCLLSLLGSSFLFSSCQTEVKKITPNDDLVEKTYTFEKLEALEVSNINSYTSTLPQINFVNDESESGYSLKIQTASNYIDKISVSNKGSTLVIKGNKFEEYDGKSINIIGSGFKFKDVTVSEESKVTFDNNSAASVYLNLNADNHASLSFGKFYCYKLNGNVTNNSFVSFGDMNFTDIDVKVDNNSQIKFSSLSGKTFKCYINNNSKTSGISYVSSPIESVEINVNNNSEYSGLGIIGNRVVISANKSKASTWVLESLVASLHDHSALTFAGYLSDENILIEKDETSTVERK